MLNLYKIILFLFTLGFLFNCNNNSPKQFYKTQEGNLTISGKATFDRIFVSSDYRGLDYNNIQKVSIKNSSIKIFDEYNNIVSESKTDNNGNYIFYKIPSKFKIAVYANILDNNSSIVKIVDNTTTNKLLYAMETQIFNRDTNTIININASSGWNKNENKYDVNRPAASFSILNSIQKGMVKVKAMDPNIIFPPLVVNWSKKNRATASFNAIEGHIVSSSYVKGGQLWILGDENGDTDEYDESVIIHEWCHYFEDKFSRTDNIGGAHSHSDKLDMRVSFSEGLANAFSGMMLDNKNYYDTSGSYGWSINLENNLNDNKGWYVEASVHSILYKLYLNYNFDSIYKTLRLFHPKQVAFLSLFTFIKGFNSYQKVNINNLLSKENLSPINDIYGKEISNNPMYQKQSLYTKLILNSSKEICVGGNIDRNKLGNYLYGYFDIESNGKYQISNNSNELATLYVYQLNNNMLEKLNASKNINFNLNIGKYLFELDNISSNNKCFELILKNKE